MFQGEYLIYCHLFTCLQQTNLLCWFTPEVHIVIYITLSSFSVVQRRTPQILTLGREDIEDHQWSFSTYYGEKIFVSLFIEEHYGSIIIIKEHIYKSLKLK